MSKPKPNTTEHNSLGLALFAVYLVLYGGFVFLNAFAPTTMETTPIAGVNLAILYGFGLIAAALAMAVAYGVFGGAANEVAEHSSKEKEERS